MQKKNVIVFLLAVFLLTLSGAAGNQTGAESPYDRSAADTLAFAAEMLEQIKDVSTDKRNFRDQMQKISQVMKALKKAPPSVQRLVEPAQLAQYERVRRYAKQHDRRAFAELDELARHLHSTVSGFHSSRTDVVQSTDEDLPRDFEAAYSQAVIRQAILEQRWCQLRKIDYYRQKAAAAPAAPALNHLKDQLRELDQLLQVDKPTPDYHQIDLKVLEERLAAIEKSLDAMQPEAIGSSLVLEKSTQPPRFGIQIGKSGAVFQLGSPLLPMLKALGFDFVSPHSRAINFSMEMATQKADSLDSGPYQELIRRLEPYDLGLRLAVSDAGFYGVPDHWLKKQHRDITWVNSAGQTADRSGAHSMLNIWNPAVVDWITGYAGSLADRMKHNAGVAVYELFNEPVMRLKNQPVGYGQLARAAFHQYLQEMYYGDLAELNRRWGTSFEGFADAAPPADLTPSADAHHTAGIYDFERFRQQSYVQYFGRIIKAIKAADPDTPVMSQLYERLVKREPVKGRAIVGRGIDFYAMARLDWDFLGNHDWPYDRHPVDLLYTWSINRYSGHALWNDEFIWSAWEGFSGRPRNRQAAEFVNQGERLMRGVMSRNIWRHLAWSRDGLIFYNLDAYWPGWNNNLMDPRPEASALRYCAGVIPVIKRQASRLADYISNSRIQDGGVYILHSNISHLVGFPHQKSVGLMQKMIADLLQHQVIPVVVPEMALLDGSETLSGCQSLICPYTTHLDDKTSAMLLEWVEKGGHLMLLGPAGVRDPYGREREGLMQRLFGVQPVFSSAAQGWRHQGDALPQKQVAFGKGRADFFPDEGYANFMQKLLADVEAYRRVSIDQADIEIIPKKTPDGQAVILALNLSPVEPREGRITVQTGHRSVTDLSVQGGVAVPANQTEGRLSFSIWLPPGDLSVFLIQ